MAKKARTRAETGTDKRDFVPQRPGRQAYISPWRLSYILGPKDKHCFFCEAAKLPADEPAWKKLLLLHRGKGGMVIMNRYPYTGGHVLIAPLRHTADLPGLSELESRYLWEYSRRSVDIIAQIVSAQGYNVGMNLGKAAGAGVEEHLHMHALPRWHGDTNFMHIVADTSLVPLSLDELWDKMRPLYKKFTDDL
ncbi:MAG TPA: HIT domain-containing protein [Planctomycetota bacterium]|nr:HIT domain-containing protein [Planctomycetota bacterium]